MKLTRTRVGEFMLDDTLTLNQISALVLKGEIEDRITGIDKIFSDYQEITFAEEYSRYLHNGNKLSREQIPADAAISDNENTECTILINALSVYMNFEMKCFIRLRYFTKTTSKGA